MMLNKKGFTLVEVVVVTIIIAVLALIVVPSFKNSALTNQMEKAKIGLVEFTTAVKLYNEVHPSGHLIGVFDNDKMDALVPEGGGTQGYTYLQNPGRWTFRHGSSTEYSLKDSTAENGVLNCRYEIGDSSNSSILSQVKCKFNKIDETGTECYLFFIQRDNPAVIKKNRYEDNTNECDDL